MFEPRMNTNEREYYFRSGKLVGRHFHDFIRDNSCSFVAKILFLESDCGEFNVILAAAPKLQVAAWND